MTNLLWLSSQCWVAGKEPTWFRLKHSWEPKSILYSTLSIFSEGTNHLQLERYTREWVCRYSMIIDTCWSWPGQHHNLQLDLILWQLGVCHIYWTYHLGLDQCAHGETCLSPQPGWKDQSPTNEPVSEQQLVSLYCENILQMVWSTFWEVDEV